MRIKLISAAALTLATAAALATPVHATSAAGECQALIEELRADTDAATSLGKSGPRLAAKADAAAEKLSENKVADALEKLIDYDSTLDALFSAPKPKVSETDYAALNTGVETAIACVDEINPI